MIQLLDIKKDVSHEDKTIDWNSFFAPELCKGGTVSFKTDVWSIGAVIYLIVAGSVL